MQDKRKQREVLGAPPNAAAAETVATFAKKPEGPALKTEPMMAPSPALAPAPVSSLPPPRVERPQVSSLDENAPLRRIARRRPAGPVRGQIAANDDAPSLGGLIHSLDQKPSSAPFKYAAIGGVIWGLLGAGFAWSMFAAELSQGAELASLLARPATFLVFAAIAVPVAVMWFLALLSWRAEELKLRSSTMTEVAVRLAEPDRMAEQSVASLGQAVRRQVSFMNDAVSRALGRAGELEALVHNQVADLERAYEDNERKIRGLIEGLSGERSALLDTSDRVTQSLRTLGDEVPALIEKLSHQQVKLADIIAGAGTNLSSLENAITQSVGRLETTLGAKTEHLQAVLTEYTDAVGGALGSRTEEMQAMLEAYTSGLASAIGNRTQNLQIVFEEYAHALDTTLANRAQALDVQLVDRTRSLDAAFSERLRLFDESIVRSTMAIDTAVGDKARALTTALDKHAKTFSDTVGRQAVELDEALMHGINSVRRSSENIARQSLKAIEGLAGQSDLLKNVSENLLTQISGVTNRFDNQGQSILNAANALESANYKIDATLQNRHNDLKLTLERMSGKADEFGRFVEGYSSTIEGSLSEAELRARAVAEEIRTETENRQRAAFADLERMKAMTDAEGERALEELRRRVSKVSNEVNTQLGTLGSRFDQTSEEVRQRAARASAELAEQEARLREHMERLPVASRENTDAMRRALQDQLKALEQLSQISARGGVARDVMPPIAGGTLTSAYTSEAQPESGGAESSRALSSLPRAEGWSFGDLLARASRDEDAQSGFVLDASAIARALDPATTQAIWSRLRNGQRGVMVRSIYSADGRATFDEVSRRYKIDSRLRETVQQYLSDFERILADADRSDPSGRAAQGQVVSETGRVYLFLAHASGRLA